MLLKFRSLLFPKQVLQGQPYLFHQQDQDVAALIKEFGYEVYEEIRPVRDDIWKIY